MTTCLKNLAMSRNLTAVMEMSAKNLVTQAKLFLAKFMFMTTFMC